ncbi:MAG: SLATT domain-containing protein [Gordonia paraffinivorans]
MAAGAIGVVERECLRLQKDIHYTEKAHYASAEALLRVHHLLGVVSVVAGACATATVLSDTLVVAGVAGLVAAVSSAVLTFVNPQSMAAMHLKSGHELGALKVQARQIRSLDIEAGACHDLEVLREKLSVLAAKKAESDAKSPATSERSFRKAKKKTSSDVFLG